MSQKTFSTSLVPEIFIEQIGGDLQVKGWDRPEVVMRSDSPDLQVEEQDDSLRVSCDANCEIRLPTGATVQLETAQGAAHFRILEDHLKIDTVHGSLHLRNVSETDIETVHGELVARQVAGNLVARQVHGNATVRDIQGHCILEEVMGNLDLRDIEGDIQTSVQGNLRLRLSIMSGSLYNLQAQGDAYCRIPEEVHLKLILSSEAESITVKLPDGTKVYNQPLLEITLGDNQTASEAQILTISAGGSLYLSARESGWSEEEGPGRAKGFEHAGNGFSEEYARQFETQIEAQIEAQMANMTRQINEQMEKMAASFGNAGMSPEQRERILRRAQEASERANARAQEKIQRSQEKLERKMEAARHREEQRSREAERGAARQGKRGWHFEWSVPTPPAHPTPPQPPVSEDERLLILLMLEQKKISLEEAEMLLAALEGK